jgi:uncharacterized protein
MGVESVEKGVENPEVFKNSLFLPLKSRLIVDPKRIEREFIVDLPKLKLGRNEQEFAITDSFFENFNYGPVKEGKVAVKAVMDKFNTHLDVRFHFEGVVTLHCDRCLEPYPHQVAFDTRIIFTFAGGKEFDTDEVVAIDKDTAELSLAKDFYDFLMLEIPLRKVPEAEVHECAPEVMKLLEEVATDEEEGEEEVDPRWSGLEALKKKFKDN